jgi:hypothetical protein
VQRARYELLARARLAAHENRRVRLGDTLDQAKHLFHGRVLRPHAPELLWCFRSGD